MRKRARMKKGREEEEGEVGIERTKESQICRGKRQKCRKAGKHERDLPG